MHRHNRGQRRARRLALSTGLLLLAAGLRLWALAQVPPGLHHDEAFHLLSARAIVAGARPVYITGNQGNEPLYAYLASLAVRLLGETRWAGRLLAAWVGVVSVALTVRLGQAMFPGRSVGRWAGLILACLYWHLTMSRWGSQPILSAAAAAGAMLGLWRGARAGSLWAYVLGGASLSFGLWSYAAFRVFPLVALAGGLALLAAERRRAQRLVVGGLLAAGVGTLMYAPLGLFFLRHPGWFTNRYSQISALRPSSGASTGERLAASAGRVAASLAWPGAGDQDWRQNLPGRPALDPVQALLFGLGAGLALRRWRSPQALALGAWVVVGLAPSVLTEFPPQYGRTVMATPALALLAGLGADGAWALRRPWLRLGLALALAASGLITIRDYFVRWARDEHLFVAFDAGLQQVAAALRRFGPSYVLYETPVFRDYPTFEYTLGPDAYGRFRAFNGRACTVLPAVTWAPTAFGVIVAEDGDTLPRLQAAFPGGALDRLSDWLGRDYAVLYQVPSGQTADLGPGDTAAEFGGLLRLRSVQLDRSQAQPGGALRMEVAWELIQSTPARLSAFVHVLGPPQADGSVVYAQYDSEPCDNAYPSWQWRPGEVLIETLRVPLPETLPAGTYDVTTGWYDAVTLQRLPATGSGPIRQGSLVVETLGVP